MTDTMQTWNASRGTRVRPSRRTARGAVMAVRMLADAVMVNTAFVLGFTLRWVWYVAFEYGAISGVRPERAITPRGLFDVYVGAYAQYWWMLTAICIAVFYLSGFYTYGRAYRGRYKAIVVAQSASLSYVIFGAVFYFAGGLLGPSRGVLLLAWALTLAFLVGARLWSTLWRAVAATERQVFGSSTERAVERVLVIGGAGYVGSALLPKLLQNGYRVRVLDLFVYGSEPIASVVDHPHLELMHADFRQVDKVTEAMRDVDAVIHLGAIVGDPACALDEDLTIDVNLMATRMVAEVAKGMGVNRFIFASTCSVYGACDELLDERSALNPVSLYGRSKVASEVVLLGMGTSGFAPVVLRFGTIYGLSGRTRFDLVVNVLAAKAAVEGQIPVFGGDQWRPFVHVDDVALAVQMVLDAPLEAVRNQIFNVGSDEQNYTIAQVGEIVHQLVPGATLLMGGADGDRRNYRVNFTKIRRTLGYAPRWTLEQGIHQVLDAIASGKVADYRDARFSNVKFLSEDGARHLAATGRDWARRLIEDAGLPAPPEEGTAPVHTTALAPALVPAPQPSQ